MARERVLLIKRRPWRPLQTHEWGEVFELVRGLFQGLPLLGWTQGYTNPHFWEASSVNSAHNADKSTSPSLFFSNLLVGSNGEWALKESDKAASCSSSKRGMTPDREDGFGDGQVTGTEEISWNKGVEAASSEDSTKRLLPFLSCRNRFCVPGAIRSFHWPICDCTGSAFRTVKMTDVVSLAGGASRTNMSKKVDGPIGVRLRGD